MDALITMYHLHFQLILLFIFFFFTVQALPLPIPSSPQQNFITCKPEHDRRNAEAHCSTFAVLRANSYYSSLSNLSIFLGVNPRLVAEASGFSPTTNLLPINHPLLLPIECKCSLSGIFQAELVRTTINGDTLCTISDSLQGLTTCKAISDRNPHASFSSYSEIKPKTRVFIPVRCSCPTMSEMGSGTKLMVSYPVSSADSVSSLALEFKVSKESIILANRLNSPNLVPYSSIFIPMKLKPVLGSIAKPKQPNLKFPATKVPQKKKKRRKKKGGVLIAAIMIAIIASFGIGTAATLVFFQWKKKSLKKQNSLAKIDDAELQKLNLSVRTIGEKKVSFEGSQSTIDGQLTDTTPHKMTLESYSLDELNKSTDGFDPHNLVEGSVYHGRLKGKDAAIKIIETERISKVDFSLFQDSSNDHPSILKLHGTCFCETSSHSFLAFEYMKNGSLKDWIHGGLAMKSQFIASCNCFLNWSQRMKICLDIAMALQYMHHVMNPACVHGNIRSRNVFLDEEFRAKLGNFGMSNCVQDNYPLKIKASPNKPSSWNRAYLAPELKKQKTASPSSDMFAFGVVLLEVVTGKTPVVYADEEEEVEGEVVMLPEKMKMVDDVREWVDGALGDDYSLEEAKAVAQMARGCVAEDPRVRPSAVEIVEKLSMMVEEGGEECLVNESSSKPLVLDVV